MKRGRVIEERVYRTTDGQHHATESAAEAHQKALDFKAWCAENICVGGEWSAEMVAKEVLEHWLVEPKH